MKNKKIERRDPGRQSHFSGQPRDRPGKSTTNLGSKNETKPKTKPMKKSFKLKNVHDVITGATRIKELLEENVFLNSLYKKTKNEWGKISAADFISLYLVAVGQAIPESALLVGEYPAVEYLRLHDLRLQRAYIIEERPMGCPIYHENGKETTQMRTYKQLGYCDCERMFCDCQVDIVRAFTNYLDWPAKIGPHFNVLLTPAGLFYTGEQKQKAFAALPGKRKAIQAAA